MTERPASTILAAALCLLMPPLSHAEGGAGLEIGGSLQCLVQADFREDGAGGLSSTLGSSAALSIELDARPQEGLRLHARLCPSIAAGNAGAPEAVDQLWGQFSLGSLDLRFGKTPIQWGTAEVFRPGSRVALESPFGPFGGSQTGTLAVVADVGTFAGFTVSGYAAFQDRFHGAGPLEIGWDSVPFGARLQAILGPMEASLGAGREARQASTMGKLESAFFAYADAGLSLDPVRLYAEAALLFPAALLPDPQNAEACAGIEWAIPALDLTARIEACHLGTGDILAGERVLLGGTYLSAGLEALLVARLAVLLRCTDGSLAVIADARLPVLDELWIGAGARAFLGPDGTEFGGDSSRGVSPRSSLYVTASVSF